MSGDKPCCAAAAAAQLRYLVVGGPRIAIAQLDEILNGAEGTAPNGENAIRIELVRLVKIYNYVPTPAENAYEDALFAEYLARECSGTPHRDAERGGKGR